jgi:Flp pilus assembly protein TadD
MITSLARLDRQKEAHTLAEAQTLVAPDNYHVARAASNAAIAFGRPRIAIFHAHRALAIDPLRADGHALLARFYQRTGNAELADHRTRMAAAIEAAIARRAAARRR